MHEALTVSQLIEKLSVLPDEQKNLPVELEGCDCFGKCVGIDVTPNEYVLLKR